MPISPPMCGSFSAIQGLNYFKTSPDQVAEKFKGITQLTFSMMLCRKQASNGRLLMFGHPVRAQSWQIASVRQIMEFLGVMTVDFDFCQCGMSSQDAQGPGLVKKKIRTMTNSFQLARRLLKSQCPCDRRHVQLTNFRAKACQEYPPTFCDEVCQVVKEELVSGSAKATCDVTSKILTAVDRGDSHHLHLHDESEECSHLYRCMGFYDDVHGQPLEKE